MANADCIIIQGSNMAECHPVAYQWVTEARLKGAKVIHIDPRFTRTSATVDKHVPIRAGSDVVFLGALINHILINDLYFKEYVVAYTNAATIITEEPPPTAWTNEYVEQALAELEEDGVDITGEGFEPLEVALQPGGA